MFLEDKIRWVWPTQLTHRRSRKLSDCNSKTITTEEISGWPEYYCFLRFSTNTMVYDLLKSTQPVFTCSKLRTRCEICSKLTIKTSERRPWRRPGVFINFEHISYLVLVFLLPTLNAGWDVTPAVKKKLLKLRLHT